MGGGPDSKHKRRNWETENVLILPKIPGEKKKRHNDERTEYRQSEYHRGETMPTDPLLVAIYISRVFVVEEETAVMLKNTS